MKSQCRQKVRPCLTVRYSSCSVVVSTRDHAPTLYLYASQLRPLPRPPCVLKVQTMPRIDASINLRTDSPTTPSLERAVHIDCRTDGAARNFSCRHATPLCLESWPVDIPI